MSSMRDAEPQPVKAVGTSRDPRNTHRFGGLSLAMVEATGTEQDASEPIGSEDMARPTGDSEIA